MVSPELLRDLGADSLLKSGELTAGQLAKEGSSSRAAHYFKAAALGKDLKDAAVAYGEKGGGIKAAGLVAWALIKVGCPVADATDFAAKTVAAGMLAQKDHVNAGQMDDLYRSYRASNDRGGDRGVFGFRQGFLSQSVSQDLRERSGGKLTQRELDHLAERTLATYCENRRYREARSAFRGDVVAWLKGNAIPWSGADASLDRLIEELQEREQAFRERTRGAALPAAGRIALARALLKGGRAEADRVMAQLYSQHFGGSYDAAGTKAGEAAPASAARGAFVLAKVQDGLTAVRPVPGQAGAYEYSAPLGRDVQAKVTWSVPVRIVPGQPATFRVQGQMTGPGQGGGVYTFTAAGSATYGLGGIALWQPQYYGLPARTSDADSFDLILPADLPNHFETDAQARRARTYTLKTRPVLPTRLIEASDFNGFAVSRKRNVPFATNHGSLVFCREQSLLTPATNVTYLVFNGPCETSYEYHWEAMH